MPATIRKTAALPTRHGMAASERLVRSSVLDRLPAFREKTVIVHPLVTLATYFGALVIFAISLGLRFFIDEHLQGTFPYVTFFPAVVLVSFIFGIRQGALVAFLGGLASWYFFIPPYFSFDFSLSTAIAMALYIFVVVTDIGLTALMISAYRAEKNARAAMQRLAEQQEVMAQELDHRLKNVFATINAIISLSQKHAADVGEFSRNLRDRLNAMARSNLLLRGLRAGEETSVKSVVEQAVSPFASSATKRFSLKGPTVPVGGQAVVLLSLILHELGTNAAKYGALSNESGRIDIQWTCNNPPENGEDMLTLTWRETGGPQPKSPEEQKTGFGSILLTRVLTTIKGEAHMQFMPEGLMAVMTIPFAALHPVLVTAEAE